MPITKPLFIHVLLHAESGEDIPTAYTTLRTMRYGFGPTGYAYEALMTERSRLLFADRADPFLDPSEVQLLGEPASISYMKREHAWWITKLIEEADPSFCHVILDGDLYFDSNLRELLDSLYDHNPKALMMGQYIPETTRCNMLWMARMHTHFMVFPDLLELRRVIHRNPFNTDWTPWQYVPPTVVFTHGTPVFYDTCANLFHYLCGWNYELVANFTPEMHRRYVHCCCGGSLSVLRKRLPPNGYYDLERRHKLFLTRPLDLLGTNEGYNEFMFDRHIDPTVRQSKSS